MILRRRGTRYHEVTPRFSGKALNEIAFERAGDPGLRTEELDEAYECVAIRELEGEAVGSVQSETEQLALDGLREALEALEESLGAGELLALENADGPDRPQVRQRIDTVVEGGENRLRFAYRIHPPLRVAVYRKRE